MLPDLVRKSRSVRKFNQAAAVSIDTLRSLVDLARLSPSSANRQTLKFFLSAEQKRNQLIFSQLAWAGYLPDWKGPLEGERPAAYILMLNDEELGPLKEVDAGIALQSMLLGANYAGLGSCILGSIDRVKLQTSLELPKRFRILFVLALGEPAEQVAVEPIGDDGSIRYWRDQQNLFHVPKRSLEEIIVA
ncbi:MAG: nitroreductase family protein [Deltaproteobacteria bacterium]|nr:nitroreductase family protein [Deltaproteobacteria bacterium]